MIVKRLASIENLGSMDVLCTDKTGTLTEAKIRLEQHVDPQGKPSTRVLELAYLNSFFETGLKSPLDEAILAHENIDVSAWKKIDEVPFDFERRRVSVLLDKGDGRMLVVKGASEELSAIASAMKNRAMSPDSARQDSRERYTGKQSLLEKEGFRVLGIAWREVPLDHPMPLLAMKQNWCLLVLRAFSTRPRRAPEPRSPRSRKAA